MLMIFEKKESTLTQKDEMLHFIAKTVKKSSKLIGQIQIVIFLFVKNVEGKISQ
jgi:hypothetical protein